MICQNQPKSSTVTFANNGDTPNIHKYEGTHNRNESILTNIKIDQNQKKSANITFADIANNNNSRKKYNCNIPFHMRQIESKHRSKNCKHKDFVKQQPDNIQKINYDQNKKINQKSLIKTKFP